MMTLKRWARPLLAAVLALALGAAMVQAATPRPPIVLGGDGGRVLCASNQIVAVQQVTAYAVDIVCADTGPAVNGRSYITLVAPSTARVACGKGGAPMNRGVLRDNRLRADMIDLDCR